MLSLPYQSGDFSCKWHLGVDRTSLSRGSIRQWASKCPRHNQRRIPMAASRVSWSTPCLPCRGVGGRRGTCILRSDNINTQQKGARCKNLPFDGFFLHVISGLRWHAFVLFGQHGLYTSSRTPLQTSSAEHLVPLSHGNGCVVGHKKDAAWGKVGQLLVSASLALQTTYVLLPAD